MKRNPLIAGLLSLLVPGLGHIYAGESKQGGTIITEAIVIGNLNIIILPLISLANPEDLSNIPNKRRIWAYWIPRVVHDIISLWSIVFWGWAIVDAVSATKKQK